SARRRRAEPSTPALSRAAKRRPLGRIVRRWLYKDCLRALLLERNVHCAPDGPGTVDRARRNDHALQRAEDDLRAIDELDMQLTRHDKEQFIRPGMLMPAALAFEDGQPHALGIRVQQ